MRGILKWLGVVLGVLVALIVVAGVAFVIISNGKLNRDYDIAAADLSIPTDAASIEEGERLVSIRGCTDCHGANLAGGLFVEDSAFGTFYAANLTGSAGSATAAYTPADWDRAIRHGVGSDGEALAVMPSTDYYRISDEDLARMIAYLQSLPKVSQDGPYPAPKLGPLAYVLVGLGQLPIAAEVIDHDVKAPASVVVEASAEYGAYVATTCTGCHGVDFAGGAVPGSAPDDPPAANLTPAGDLANWTQEDFVTALRTGSTPEGKQLDPEVMPWPIATRMTDTELTALWLYLSSLEPMNS